MIWADRVGIAGLLLWLLWFVSATSKGHDDMAVFLFVLVVAGPWIVCRLLHFIFTGRIAPR